MVNRIMIDPTIRRKVVCEVSDADFEKFKEMTKLDTIMEILEYIYKHFCYSHIELIDSADFSCFDDKHNRGF